MLPFRALTHDSDSAHLSLALADATTGELALVRSLLVRPTAAILRYDRQDVDPIEAGRELDVDAIVTGTFQRAGSRLRVSVQLISVAEERPLWSTKIDTSLDDLFAMQDEVSRKIVEALQLELTPADQRRLGQHPQAGADVVDLILKGRTALRRGESGPEVSEAINYFRKASELEPANPLPWIGLADAYTRLAFTWDPEGDWHHRAAELAERALQLDGDLPEGRYIRGRLAWSPQGGFDHALAMTELAAAMRGRPNLGEAYHWLGTILFHVGLPEEARDLFERALRIDPDDAVAATHLPYCDMLDGDYQEALRRSREALAGLAAPWSVYTVAQAQVRLGDLSGAEKTLDAGAEQFPGVVLFHSLRAIIAALRDRREAAEREMQLTVQNQKSFGHYHHAEFDLACALSILGRTEEAVKRLRSVAATGYPCLPGFEVDPLLERARGHPSYDALRIELAKSRDEYRALYRNLQAWVSAA